MIFISFALALLALYLLYRWALPKPIPGIPRNPDALRSLFGDIPAVIRDTKARDQTHMDWILQQMVHLNSPIIQLFLNPLHRPTVILADFRETQDIMLRRKEFDRSIKIRELLEPVIPNHHIYLPTNSTFRAHRKLVQDVMLPPFIKSVAGPAFHANITSLVRVWEMKAAIANKSPFVAAEDIQGAVMDAVYSFTFGNHYKSSTTLPKISLLEGWKSNSRDTGSDEPFEFPQVIYDDLINATVGLIKAPEGLQGSPIAKWMAKLSMKMPAFRRIVKTRDEFLRNSLESSVSQLVKDKNLPVQCALDQMVRRETALAKTENRSPNYFSSTMQGELFGLILGGAETTSTTTLWGLKFLTDNPSAQKRLRSALESSFTEAKAQNRSPSFQELADARIPYLEAVIEEILRCAGAAPALARFATVDTQILGYHIPRGTDILFLTRGPDVWSPGFEVDESKRSQSCQAAVNKNRGQAWDTRDMTAFKPERWLKGTQEEFDRSAGPTLAFGLGTRACFGRRLAYQQLKTSISILTWNFQFLSCPPELSSYRTIEGMTSMPENTYIRLAKTDFTVQR